MILIVLLEVFYLVILAVTHRSLLICVPRTTIFHACVLCRSKYLENELNETGAKRKFESNR